ncbi:MAG TPA: hypothetical protein VE401_01735 [Solirubrobacterales bacterium]|nr:hypothetical protein [Solirubrobacterales bacterium]HZA88928.1 hypothetical protein [Solirubrobacterales bacterium]
MLSRRVAPALLALLAAPPAAGADPVTIDTPLRNVSRTHDLAEAEPTISYNPTNPKNIIVGGNLWQPLTQSDNWDLIGLRPTS